MGLQDSLSQQHPSPLLMSEISKSLEATRLLHGGKPLPGMQVPAVESILEDDIEKPKAEGARKRNKSKPVHGQLLQAYFPSIVKKKSSTEQEDYSSIHGQVYLQNQIPGTHKRSKSKKSKGSINHKLSSKENSAAVENLVLLHEYYGKHIQPDPFFESGGVPFQIGGHMNQYGRKADQPSLKKGSSMIAHNMASAEAISNTTVMRRNSLQGNQSMQSGKKLPPIINGNNVGLNRKIQAQC